MGIGSNHAIDLKAADLRRRLIEHAHNPLSVSVKLETDGKKTDSIFERRVLETLVRRGYKVSPQWPVGKFRIDLVVEGRQRRLALELDGEKFHPPEKLAEDMERQAMLERAGWQFMRIRGSIYFRDPERALGPLYEILAEMGIEPEAKIDSTQGPSSERLSEILRVAERIRREWGYEVEEPGKPDAPEPTPLEDLSTIEIDLPLTIQSIAKVTGRSVKNVSDEAWKRLRFDGDPISVISKKETPDFLRIFNLTLSD